MAMAPRIFPVRDLAAAHEPAAGAAVANEPENEPENEPATIQPSLTRGRSFSLPWRPRPKSVLLALNENTMSQNFEDGNPPHGDPTDPEHHGEGALRSIVRRASASLRGFVQRDYYGRRSSAENATDRIRHAHSHTHAHSESRPGSSWQRLRQRASFIHHPRDLDRTMYNAGAPPSPTFPVPGSGTEPPIIPRHTGAAAKAAAAAAQGEFFVNTACRNKFSVVDNDIQGDRESGIGINMAASEAGTETEEEEEAYAPKVDFVAALPVELAIQVCSMLDVDHLLAASEVSRTWNFVIRNQHVWRESFLRKMATTFATGSPALPGVGLGIPPALPDSNWKHIYQARETLDQNWREGKVVATHLVGHTDSIYCVQFDESKIITGSRDRTIRIWDMHTFECRLVIGPPDVVNRNDLFLDERGAPVHCAQRDGVEVATSMPAAVSFPVHHHASVLCLQYDDRILVTGSSDSTCIVHNMRSGYRPICRLVHHDAAVLDVVFDEKHIVTCSKDISICVWDRETGALLKQLRGHTGPVNAVQLRDNTIVSCSGDFLVKLWNIDTGLAVREFSGHTKGLACSQFSEDGKYIASAGNDKTIRVWDANTGDCVHEMQAHDGLVRSLHIDNVSGRLISASYDQDIKVWDLETGSLLLDFPKWHHSWVLAARSDYRRIVSTGQDPKILIMDFGASVPGINLLESVTPSGLDVSEHQRTFI